MPANSLEPPVPPELDTGTKLALERTYLAHERTQMAWLRTSFSLISFGFTIAKFFEFLKDQNGQTNVLFGPRTVGVFTIVIGLVSLLLSDVGHRRALKALRQHDPDLPISQAGVVSLLIATIGILALIGAIMR
jgi:putative membrane protein